MPAPALTVVLREQPAGLQVELLLADLLLEPQLQVGPVPAGTARRGVKGVQRVKGGGLGGPGPRSLLHVLAQRLAQALLGRLQLADDGRHGAASAPARLRGRGRGLASHAPCAEPGRAEPSGAEAPRVGSGSGSGSGIRIGIGIGAGIRIGAAAAMPGLLLGDEAPDFEADTTQGRIRFHDFLGDS